VELNFTGAQWDIINGIDIGILTESCLLFMIFFACLMWTLKAIEYKVFGRLWLVYIAFIVIFISRIALDSITVWYDQL
jgi:hypothetical protein